MVKTASWQKRTKICIFQGKKNMNCKCDSGGYVVSSDNLRWI